jgi:hypothetical protein
MVVLAVAADVEADRGGTAVGDDDDDFTIFECVVAEGACAVGVRCCHAQG